MLNFKKIFLTTTIIFFFIISTALAGANKDLFNSFNFASYFNNYLGYLYDSHGCLHFTGSNIYLLAKTIPAGSRLKIMKYSATELPKDINKIPYYSDITKDEANVEKHAKALKDGRTELVVYPSRGVLIIYLNKKPYAKVTTLAGPPYYYKAVFSIQRNADIEKDPYIMTPTDPGDYKILGGITDYHSAAYYVLTRIPFGAELIKTGDGWIFEDGGRWQYVQREITYDIELPADKRQFNYYDTTLDKNGRIASLKWGSNEFGKYALLWSKGGKIKYPELGYCDGVVLYEQIMLVKNIADILTKPGADDLDKLITGNKDFEYYRDLYSFIESKGEIASKNLDPEMSAYYKLWYGFNMTKQDYYLIDDRIENAFRSYQKVVNAGGNILNFPGQTIGLVNFLKLNVIVYDKEANWYAQLKKDWDIWQKFRVKIREDFNFKKIDQSQRSAIVEDWLSKRLEFEKIK